MPALFSCPQKAGSLAYENIKYVEAYVNFLYIRLRYQEALHISQEQLTLSQQIKSDPAGANAYNNISVQYRCLGNPGLCQHEDGFRTVINKTRMDKTNNTLKITTTRFSDWTIYPGKQ